MLKKVFILASISVVITVLGCGVVMQKQSRATNERLMQVQIGMDRQQLLSLMGNPYRREVYGDNEFLIYETDHWAKQEKDRFIPILLKNGKVSGWGRNYYDYTERSKIEADIQVKQK